MCGDNNTDWVDVAFCTTVIVIVLALIAGLVDVVAYNPERMDLANEKCRQMGYDQYKDFSSPIPFSLEIHGLKCENVNTIDVQLNNREE